MDSSTDLTATPFMILDLDLARRLNVSLSVEFGGAQLLMNCPPVAIVCDTGPLALSVQYRSNPLVALMLQQEQNYEGSQQQNDEDDDSTRMYWSARSKRDGMQMYLVDPANLDSHAPGQTASKCVQWAHCVSALGIHNFYDRKLPHLRLAKRMQSELDVGAAQLCAGAVTLDMHKVAVFFGIMHCRIHSWVSGFGGDVGDRMQEQAFD